jgi:nucleolar complex protein 2
VLELLADHLRQWALSIAFPELAHLPLLALRGYAKASPVERFRRHAKSLADALSRNTAWVGAARDGVAYAPHDLGAVAGFLAGQEAKVRRVTGDG